MENPIEELGYLPASANEGNSITFCGMCLTVLRESVDNFRGFKLICLLLIKPK